MQVAAKAPLLDTCHDSDRKPRTTRGQYLELRVIKKVLRTIDTLGHLTRVNGVPIPQHLCDMSAYSSPAPYPDNASPTDYTSWWSSCPYPS